MKSKPPARGTALPGVSTPPVRPGATGASSTRQAAQAAGAAVTHSAVSLAFFLSRKPNPHSGRRHAKFRA